MRILVAGSFDDYGSHHVRLLQEAHRLGSVHVLLWSDRVIAAETGKQARFPQAERLYLVAANRYVSEVIAAEQLDSGGESGLLPPQALLGAIRPDIWLDTRESRERADFCARRGFEYRTVEARQLSGFPEHEPVQCNDPPGGDSIPQKKVVVTGCFDWFHSGHVRFFEEASVYGKLYVVVGSDENLRLLKGEGHPLFPQDERRYLVGSVRYVWQALLSTGGGWLDAEPEIGMIRPDLYIVNEDGDRPEKRAFCREQDLEYLVLSRAPKQGLAPRTSTDLRGY